MSLKAKKARVTASSVTASSSKVLESPTSPGLNTPPGHEAKLELGPASRSAHMDTIGENVEPHLSDEGH